MLRQSLIDQLYQEETWRDARGKVWKLEDMAPSHRSNLIALLERCADRLRDGAIMAMISGPGPSGDMACDAFDQELSYMESCEPIVWLKDVPLYRRLKKIDADRRAVYVRTKRRERTVPSGTYSLQTGGLW